VTIKIQVTNVYVDDQDKAPEFYTTKLGFERKTDIPLGEYRWLSVFPAGQGDCVKLLLNQVTTQP
jgi:catechol 2,3-dioxygenase-like lactoylglutathione lyase family enzyme